MLPDNAVAFSFLGMTREIAVIATLQSLNASFLTPAFNIIPNVSK